MRVHERLYFHTFDGTARSCCYEGTTPYISEEENKHTNRHDMPSLALVLFEMQ